MALIALYAKFKNQFALEREILEMTNTPYYIWEQHPFIITHKQQSELEQKFNYLIFYILGNTSKDIYRKVLWAYLQNFILPSLKLNEVRDFKIFEYDELESLLKYVQLGTPLITAWSNVFIQLDKIDELIKLLQQKVMVAGYVEKNIALYTCFYHSFSKQQQQVIMKNIYQLPDSTVKKRLQTYLVIKDQK